MVGRIGFREQFRKAIEYLSSTMSERVCVDVCGCMWMDVCMDVCGPVCVRGRVWMDGCVCVYLPQSDFSKKELLFKAIRQNSLNGRK